LPHISNIFNNPHVKVVMSGKPGHSPPNFIPLLLLASLLAGCVPALIVQPTPTALLTRPPEESLPAPSPTPSPTLTTTPTSTPTATPEVDFTPTYFPFPTATPVPPRTPTTGDRILLEYSYFDTRVENKIYFHVIVKGLDAGFAPRSIRIVERSSGDEVERFELFEPAESVCYLGIDVWKLYETQAIKMSDLPRAIHMRQWGEEFVFQIAIEHLDGRQEVVERFSPDNSCVIVVD